MDNVTISQIEEQLRLLPPEKLAVVFDFVFYLARRQMDSAYQTMLASESALRRDWQKPEEEAAWASL